MASSVSRYGVRGLFGSPRWATDHLCRPVGLLGRGEVIPPQVATESCVCIGVNTEQRRHIRLNIKRRSLWKPRVVLIPKVPALKRKWQLAAEAKFLAERQEVPPGAYVQGLNPVHLASLDSHFMRVLDLKAASLRALSHCRTRLMREAVGRNVFDTRSLAVQVTDLTEKILSIRAHILRLPRERTCHRALSIALGKRHRAMKALYKTDYALYHYVCQVACLRPVRFSIPDSRDRTKAISRLGVDGDRARFLIRQRFWRAKHRPRATEDEKGRRVLPVRHSMDSPDAQFGKPKRAVSEVSKAWPYGVSSERMTGTHTVRNPTAPGRLHVPVPLVF